VLRERLALLQFGQRVDAIALGTADLILISALCISRGPTEIARSKANKSISVQLSGLGFARASY